jgi:hypothetical protein
MGGINRRNLVQTGPGKRDPIWEMIKTKRAGDVVQMIHLPSKRETLSSNSTTIKKIQKHQKNPKSKNPNQTKEKKTCSLKEVKQKEICTLIPFT